MTITTDPEYFKLFDCTLAGYKHHDIPNPASILNKTLSLEIEPRNPHDNTAVAVYHGLEQAGYVARSILKEVVFRLKQHGYNMHAKVTQVDASGVVLSIYLPTQTK
jgi:hypothetical protein